MELTALKVKIRQRPDGSAWYPSFEALPCVMEKGQNWSKYVDVHGEGWLYDRISGHKEETPDSPRGQQFGILIVPEVFAKEAVEAFPTLCAQVNESELASFYDNKAYVDSDDEIRDATLIQSLKAEYSMLKDLAAEYPDKTKITERFVELKAKLVKALDPDDDAPGVKRNWRKKWATAKAKLGITIKEP